MTTLTGRSGGSTLSAIRDLVRINIDTAQGFAAAAEHVGNPEIRALFDSCARQRRQFAGELCYAACFDDDEIDDGSFKGMLHRWWIDLRGMLQDGSEHAMLAEAERGEDEIVKRYEKILREHPDTPLNSLLQSQYRQIRVTHDAIRAMRDART